MIIDFKFIFNFNFAKIEFKVVKFKNFKPIYFCFERFKFLLISLFVIFLNDYKIMMTIYKVKNQN